MAETGGKPPSGSSPGRPAADTPQRLVVRSIDASESAVLGASDTAVAMAESQMVAPTDSIGLGTTGPTPGPSPSPSITAELVGTTLSERYQVTKKIGQGGMGAVYEAKHTEIGGRFAIKVLLEKYAQRENIVARLKKEAQLATSLDHENIIRVTDFGNTKDGRTYVVMEYLEGESLAECLAREHELPEQRILRIASQAASALAAAHAKSIVHRDIKPENLFLLKRKDEDFVKVVDFGISKNLRQSSEEEEAQRLTQTGMVLGTPLYMSPEQARGDEDLDHRVDIYALGVIMYEAAAGRVPFAGNNYLSVISQVLNEQPKPLHEIRPDLSEEFDAIVMRAMAKNRNDRYPDAQAMLTDLTAVLEDPTRSTERAKITGPRRLLPKPKIPKIAWWIGGVPLLICLVVLAVVLLMGGEKKSPPNTNQPGHVPAPVDAAVATTTPADAAIAPPEGHTVKVRFESDPPGSMVVGAEDGREWGVTPRDVVLPVHDEKELFLVQLAGYDDRKVTINPIAQDKENNPVKIKLVKAVGRAAKTTKVPKTDGGAGSAQPQGSHAGGELGGNPFH
jgi:serine/threonine-protein kinase